jgi:AmmeMemoRadiSam system protein A
MEGKLSENERKQLLGLAREALEYFVTGRPLPSLDLEDLSRPLREHGASFVTLTRKGQLRGCIGSLTPNQPLAEDVREHAIKAASQDYRFPVIKADELSEITIEVSRLTIPQDLEYEIPEDLAKLIRPGIDGVILVDGFQRATFLPQVWEKLPEPAIFLEHLCMKMGASPDLWRTKKLDVQIYQVEEFHE